MTGPSLNRRHLLGFGLTAVVASGLPSSARALAAPRALAFENLHTGEKLSTVYWADGRYIGGAVGAINNILRDHRNGEVHAMDPRLFDLLYALRGVLDTSVPFQIISGYRSPRTNAMLANHSDGVARHSLHTEGLAIDIRVPGRALATVRDAALSLRGGGVGYYRRSDFVHVDTGRVRAW